jgi:O-antigen biosynthesis protein
MVRAWLGGALRRVKRRLGGIAPAAAPATDTAAPYERFRIARLASRRAVYQCEQQPGLLSLVTTVWNTDLEYLRILARSVLEQEGGTCFEWVILDNGSTKPSTIEYLTELGNHPCVRLHRTPHNLGIIGGMRHCLERAAGRYVVPVDSDDYLYPDCVRILTWHIARSSYPALLYTDEDKLAGETFLDPYFKPDWDPVLFVDSCYIAHLCAIDRERALRLGVYTDPRTEGSHDGDTFMRFHLEGHRPVHVPEVVYSWRMHAQSTAANMDSKSYIHESQKAVLARFVEAQPRGERYAVEASPFFAGTPDWWIRPQATGAPVAIVVLSETVPVGAPMHADDGATPTVTLSAADFVMRMAPIADDMAGRGGLIRVVWSEVQPERADAAECAAGVMALFPDAVMVGGPVYRGDGAAVAGGGYFGFGAGCDTPDRGRMIGDPGYFAQMWKQHSVSAVSSQHTVIEAAFLARFLEDHRDRQVTFPGLGAWAGAYARRLGKRVVYTPFLRARCEADWDARVSAAEKAAFVSANVDLMPETRYLSPRLGLTHDTAYLPVTDEARRAHIDRLVGASSDLTVRRAP